MPRNGAPARLVRRRIWFTLGFVVCFFGMLMSPLLIRPALEMRLSTLFNMRVTMDHLDIDWKSQEVVIRNLRFHNQPDFIQRPHLFVAELRARADWKQLLKKNIHISEINLYRPVYVIERVLGKDEVKNNVVMWWRWIKAHRKKHDEDDFTWLSKDLKWRLLIDRINIREGEFLYHQYGGDKPERKYYFRGLQGYLSGLHWPDTEPEILDQQVFLRGWVGERFPVPCTVRGRASFATAKISFDLTGRVRNGSVLDYEHLWSGLPVTVKGGRYDLDVHVVCLRRDLRSNNFLTLKNLDLKSRRSLTGSIWGMPLKTWLRFVENEKKINLNVQLEGDIASPSVGSGEAFNEAFQKALRVKTERGFKFFTNGAVQIASQTESLVRETPGLLVGGIEKIAALVPVPAMEKGNNKTEIDESVQADAEEFE